MKTLYAREPDTKGRRLIYFAVWDRDVFSLRRKGGRNTMTTYKKVTVAVDENKARLLELANKAEPLTDDEIKEAFVKTLELQTRTDRAASPWSRDPDRLKG